MNKVKRILAIVLAMAMVMAMSVTALAAKGNPLDIPVTGAGSGATYEHLQLIEPDVTQPTGWKFSNDSIAQKFRSAFGKEDDQTISGRQKLELHTTLWQHMSALDTMQRECQIL